MLHVIRQSKSAAALLGALIVLALSINAMAGVFCQHTFGGRNCCPSKASHLHHQEAGNVAEADRHMHQAVGMSSDMSEDRMDDSSESTRESAGLANDARLQPLLTEQNNGEAITQPNEPCSHC